MKYPPIGEISSGTVRTEDLICRFSGYLRFHMESWMGSSSEMEHMAALATARVWMERYEKGGEGKSDEEKEGFNELGSDVLEALAHLLNDLAPPFTYFGANEGDGACFGFWVSDDAIIAATDGGEIISLSDGDVYPDFCLREDEHGGQTLTVAGTDEIIWSTQS